MDNDPIERCIIDARKGKRKALKDGDGLKYLNESAKEYFCKRVRNTLKKKN